MRMKKKMMTLRPLTKSGVLDVAIVLSPRSPKGILDEESKICVLVRKKGREISPNINLTKTLKRLV